MTYARSVAKYNKEGRQYRHDMARVGFYIIYNIIQLCNTFFTYLYNIMNATLDEHHDCV